MAGLKILLKHMCMALALPLLAGGCSPKKRLVEVNDYQLGTHIAIRLVPVKGRDAAGDARAELAILREEGRTLDANRDDGLFAHLAERGEYRWVSPDERALVEPMLELGISLARKTDGAFDPALGTLSRLWGFSSLTPRREPPNGEELAQALGQAGWKRILRPGPDGFRVVPGTWIDLGGIAKGVLADRMAARLRRLGYRQGILDLGGNILVLGERPDGGHWRVAVRHPRAGNRWLGMIQVRDRAVVTSGDYERFFIHNNTRYHHIVNPLTGYPADGVLSVTIVGPEAGIADALSTAMFVLGPERGLAVLQREFPDYHALFVRGGKTGGLQIQASPGFAGATHWKPAGMTNL